jgi:hypothetical protein
MDVRTVILGREDDRRAFRKLAPRWQASAGRTMTGSGYFVILLLPLPFVGGPAVVILLVCISSPIYLGARCVSN